MIPVSFEFYPPKSEAADTKLLETAKTLAAFSPNYFSVTYGANGSTRIHTEETVHAVKNATGINTVPHIAGIGSTKKDIEALLNNYQQAGITKLVALRGDVPKGEAPSGDFAYAHELIRFIREKTGDHFRISVAAYPEYHPEASSTDADLDALKKKLDAGATDIITQYFYNADAYFYFRDRATLHGINVPITVGIMPITNLERLARFSTMCGAEIPLWVTKQLQTLGDDKSAVCGFGKEVVVQLCERLQKGGANAFHFYTLNQAGPAVSILNKLSANAHQRRLAPN